MRWRTVDQLAKVAAIYGAALDLGKPPTKTVAEQLGISHSHAANLVAKARKAGRLAPFPRQRATRSHDSR